MTKDTNTTNTAPTKEIEANTADDAQKATPVASDAEKPAAKRSRRRRRRKPADAATTEQTAEKQSPKKPKKARRARKPSDDVNIADPTAAIRARIFEIDAAADDESLPPIKAILPEWAGSAPVKGSVPVRQRKQKQQKQTAAVEDKPVTSKINAPKPTEKKAVAPKKTKVKPDYAIREHIISALVSANTPLAPESILDELSVPAMDFFAALDSLEAEGRVFMTRRQRIALPSQLGFLTGILHITSRGFGFVTPDDGSADVFVAQKNLFGGMDGDTVVIKLSGSSGTSRDGEVVAVNEHAHSTMVGVYQKDASGSTFIPDEVKYGTSYPAVNLRRGAAKDGQKVVCELDYTESPAVAHVKEVLGWPDEAGTDILSIIRAHELPESFPKVVENAAKALDAPISEDDILRREDLRGTTIVTIDGRDSRDFDDAVSIEKLSDGNFLLGVHIADVAHYVKHGSAIDKEAYKRGTSVYFVDRVVPMLPESLSNGICSLNPNEDRLTLSCFMEIDGKGNVVSHRLSETVIRSAYRLVYDDVTALLSGDAGQRKKYKAIIPLMDNMRELFAILNARRVKRGSLEFEIPGANVILDEKGRAKDVVLEQRGVANRIIEEFMLVCNETVAEHMAHLDRPMLYRVHETPDEDRVKELSVFLAGFGLTLRGAKNGLHPKALQTALQKVAGRPEESVVSRVALRSLKKARYCEEDLGHFGLAADYYCHFTSPIRRYPDLVVHRIVKEMLRGQLRKDRRIALTAALPEIAQHTSEREHAAMETEREADDLKKCEYLHGHIGERFTGVISGVTGFGLFVELPNTCEGLVRISEMKDDYYVYEEKNYRYIGRHRHAIYRLGDTVTIEVTAVDTAHRKAEFALITDEEPKGRHPRRPRNKPVSGK